MFDDYTDAFTRYLQLNINKGEGYNAFELAMLSQGVEGIIKPKLNSGSQLLSYSYDIGGLVKLEQMLCYPLTDEQFALNLLLQIVELNEIVCGHMLALEQVYWSLEYVYCDQIDKKIKLIYLPQGTARLICPMSYKDFIEVIISKQQYSLLGSSMEQIKSYLKDPYFCQKGFKNLIMSQIKALDTVKSHDVGKSELTHPSANEKAELLDHKKTAITKDKKNWIVFLLTGLLCLIAWFLVPLFTGDVLEARWSIVLFGLGILLFAYSKLNKKIVIPSVKMNNSYVVPTLTPNNKRVVYETECLKPIEAIGYLSDTDGTISYRVHQKHTVIGRHHDLADVVIPSPTVGRKHAVISIHDSVAHIEDCNSKNGTRINGKRLDVGQTHKMSSGDILELADFSLVFTTMD